MDNPNITAQAVEKVSLVAIITTFFAVHRWWLWLCIIWIAFMLLDYLTGTFAALKNGAWSSKIAREGLWHKAGELLVALLAIGLDLTILVVSTNMPGLQISFQWPCLLSALIFTWYILTEAGSIIENAGELGAPIPKWLAKLIAALKGKVDDAGDGITKSGEPPDDRR